MQGNSYVIVVGVDGSASARAALRWAAAEAHRRHGSILAVTAWRWDWTEPGSMEMAQDLLEHEVEALIHNADAEVPIALRAVEGRAAGVLVNAARDADLLVLGSHGRSRQLQQVLGSVSAECIHDATCPVVVIPTGYLGHAPDAGGRHLVKAK